MLLRYGYVMIWQHCFWLWEEMWQRTLAVMLLRAGAVWVWVCQGVALQVRQPLPAGVVCAHRIRQEAQRLQLWGGAVPHKRIIRVQDNPLRLST
jgi:hypothetical protein